jgi:mono/diheme cytochrome c family protein
MAIRLKTVLVALIVLVVVLVVGAITAIGWEVVLGPQKRDVTSRRFDASPERIARGKYLVEGPAACFHCHTDHDLTDPRYPIIESKKGAGWSMPIPELNNIAARNITPDPETGIGTWSDDEIARAIREGVRKDGTALFPVMPYSEFARMDDADVEAIVAYLRTLTPVRNQVPARQLPFPLEYIVKTIPKPILAPQPSHPSATPEQRGEYIATLASCGGCHTPADDQGQMLAGMEFGGGGLFKDPGQNGKEMFSLNITPDPSGIAHYDESLFKEMIRTGTMRGRILSHIMPLEFFKNMTDGDLSDLFAYLRSLAPVKHRVSNTDPPAPCVICGRTHGLGELNKK